jgi:hypothetical protein
MPLIRLTQLATGALLVAAGLLAPGPAASGPGAPAALAGPAAPAAAKVPDDLAVNHAPRGTDPAAAPVSEGEPRYMPLTAGRTMTYQTPTGARFTLTFEAPVTLSWFDGTIRRAVPVLDSRCGCRVLMQDFQGGVVRAVGTMTGERIQAWGEPVIIFPGADQGVPDPIRTPAGSFPDAIRIDSDGGSAWFAPDVGLVQVNEYRLVTGRSAV